MRLFFLFIIGVLLIGSLSVVYLPLLRPNQELIPVVATKRHGFVLATGSIEAREDVVLAFEGSGIVRDITYDVGDTVPVGSVVASLDAGTLLADVEAQRLRVQKEDIRLSSFEGPEEKERAQIDASVFVAQRKAESSVHGAVAAAQQIAGEVENMIRTEVDDLFNNVTTDPKLTSKYIAVTDRRDINQIRSDFENVFTRWRTWSGVGRVSQSRASSILQTFESDLRYLHGGIVTLYDTFLQLRGLSDENDQSFLLIARVRSQLLKHIVTVSQHTQNIAVAHAEYSLARAQSDQQLSGGTKTDRLAQSAQVGVEREQLRRLELQLAKTQIRAPFSGVVGDIFIQSGEFTAAGAGAIRLVSQGGFDLSVAITEVDIQNITVGQRMQAQVGATGEELTAVVRTISETEKRVDDVPVYTVTFSLVETESDLRPGMTVDVQVPVGNVTQVFIIPRSALVMRDGTYTVSVRRGDTTLSVEVMIAASMTGDQVSVTGALQEGDLVIDVKGR